MKQLAVARRPLTDPLLPTERMTAKASVHCPFLKVANSA